MEKEEVNKKNWDVCDSETMVVRRVLFWSLNGNILTVISFRSVFGAVLNKNRNLWKGWGLWRSRVRKSFQFPVEMYVSFLCWLASAQFSWKAKKKRRKSFFSRHAFFPFFPSFVAFALRLRRIKFIVCTLRLAPFSHSMFAAINE